MEKVKEKKSLEEKIILTGFAIVGVSSVILILAGTAGVVMTFITCFF